MAAPTAADPYAQLVSAFDVRVRELKGCMSLRTPTADDALAETLENIGRSLTAVEASFEALRGAVEAEKQCLPHAEAVAAKTQEQAELIARITAALPQHLPSAAPEAAPEAAAAADADDSAAAEPEPERAGLGRVSQSGANRTRPPSGAGGGRARPKSAKKKKQKAPVPTKALAYVTKDELDGLRKDVKGRLTLEKLNEGVDSLREVLAAKQHLLATARKRLGNLQPGDADRVKEWQRMVTPETEGFVFFSEDDLRDPPRGQALKTMVGATGKSMISVLRSLGRLKEVRVQRTKVYLLL